MTVAGKWALVTGAASGIGAEFCRQLEERGFGVLKVDCRPAPGEYSLLLDLTDQDAAARVMAWLGEIGIVPDLLINNAGIFDFMAVADMDPRRLDLYVDLHVRAVTQLCRAMVPAIAMYAATKAYIRAFSRALRLETRDCGVSVTVACPGGIATDLFGLSPKLQRLGVRVGALYTPRRFVHGALKAVMGRRKQYINGPVNRLAIVAVGILPDWVRIWVKYLLLDKLSKK